MVVSGEEMEGLRRRRGRSLVAGRKRRNDDARRDLPLPQQRLVRYAAKDGSGVGWGSLVAPGGPIL